MSKEIKLCSWNVNGLRAVIKKDFLKWLCQSGFDIVCLQETKISLEQIDHSFRCSSDFSLFEINAGERKGYSGVANYFKESFLPSNLNTGFSEKRIDKLKTLPPEIESVIQGKKETTMNYSGEELSKEKLKQQIANFNREGRILESWHNFDKDKSFILFNIYFPNGGASTERLKFKLEFYELFLLYLELIKKETPYIVITGDFNTAHHEIDLARPKENLNVSGFIPIERLYLDRLEEQGFIDSFRYFNPKKADVYTWWSFRTAARKRNVGWRIDYFYISQELIPYLKSAEVHDNVEGSDHCPVSICLGNN